MNINYEYYRIFYHVARLGNMTLAADFLHNNQPNISRTVKLLEQMLGCALIIRSNRGITLTPEGKRLYSHVKIAVAHFEDAEEELARTVGLSEGIITIGTSETALHLFLLPILNQFKEEYPDIRIRIRAPLTGQAIHAVKEGLVDFAVVATPAHTEAPLKCIPVMDFQDIMIGGSDYASLSASPVRLRELSKYPLVCLGSDTVTYEFYQSLYHSNRLSLKPELEAATTEQVLHMIRNNLGIGFLPEVLAGDALAKGEIYRINLCENIPKRQICFIENERHPLSLAACRMKALFPGLS